MFLVLASRSPRRRELLTQAGIPFQINVSDVSEEVSEMIPEDKVLAIAKKKGLDIFSKYSTPDVVVLSADTIVVVDTQILGKPKDKEDARRMINMLQGRKHDVYTAVYIQSVFKNESFVEKTEVEIAPMTNEEIEDYISSKEPYDKAGAYAIQGIFSKYIKGIVGDYYNVMGLPIHKVYELLKEYDFKVKKICPNCHSQLEEGVQFCTVCGTKIEKEKRNCPNCHRVNDDSNKYCIYCGSNLDNVERNDENVCPICHHINEHKSDFCESCGARMYQDKKATEFKKDTEKSDLSSQSHTAYILGIVSLVILLLCGLFPVSLVLGIVGIILGKKSINNGNEKESKIGLILSIISCIISFLIILILIIFSTAINYW